MNKLVLKQITNIQLGDLVCVEWFDASMGKRLTGGGTIDVPIKSWGVCLGMLDERNKRIILALNNFATLTSSATYR